MDKMNSVMKGCVIGKNNGWMNWSIDERINNKGVDR